MGRKSNLTTSCIEVEGSFITKPVDIANYFNDYFIDKVCKLRQKMPTSYCESNYLCISEEIMNDKNCSFKFREVTREEVKQLLLSINNDKPPGTDNLDGKLLRMVADHIATSICYIFNLSLERKVCPQVWKEAKVIPLAKNARAVFSGSNSRPISLLPAISKLLEKFLFNQIQGYFTMNELSKYQHACREGLYSTCTALVQMTDDWLKYIDHQNIVGAVLLDFSAAFDIIDHSLLQGKLKCYGFTPSALAWVESYLTDRTQKVYFNGSFSEVRSVACGIPQGSSLGPLLFSIFTNDLPLVCKRASVSMYADDVTLYMPAPALENITAALNNELQMVSNWVTDNKLVLNIAKTKSILF